MSPSSSQAVGFAAHSSGTNMGSALLGLPVELLQMILSDLPFWQMVNMSQTCRRLRAVALGQPTLWQELPNVIMSQLHTLEPFFKRSGKLGFDLDISQIFPCDLNVLCPRLDANFSHIRKLYLEIEEPDDDTPNPNWIAPLQQALASDAPLLEELSLLGVDNEPFLGGLKPDILGGDQAKAPNLRTLRLTAFHLDVVCPSLQGVTSVVASVGALSPKDTAAQNHRVHALFPALQQLEIVGISVEPAAVDPEARPLSRVPVIDQPLDLLKMAWRSEWQGEDVRAANWLATSSPHVRNVEILTAQWDLVSQAVLAPLLGTAHSMRISSYYDDEDEYGVELALSNTQRERTALVRAELASALLKTLLERAGGLPLATLELVTGGDSVALVADVHTALNALPHLRELRLDIIWTSVKDNGVFIDPETLAELQPLTNIARVHFCAPLVRLPGIDTTRRIDAQFLVHLLETVFPRARSAVVSIPLDLLPNYPVILGYQGCAVSYRPVL